MTTPAPPTFGNPYLDEVHRLFGGPPPDLMLSLLTAKATAMYAAMDNRSTLVAKYSWAIPADEAIRAVAALSPVIEIGAGTGYWARLIADAGGDIFAFDKFPVDGRRQNPYHPTIHGNHEPFCRIRQGTEQAVRLHPDRTLFLCWPPYDDKMALRRPMTDYGNPTRDAEYGLRRALVALRLEVADVIANDVRDRAWAVIDELHAFRVERDEARAVIRAVCDSLANEGDAMALFDYRKAMDAPGSKAFAADMDAVPSDRETTNG